jgi:hypothetical protein
MAIKKAKVTQKDGNTLVWEFGTGNTFDVNVEEFSEAVRHQAMLHGLKQKLSDCYSGSAGAAEAERVFKEQKASLANGTWNAGRSSSGGIWVEALAKATGVEIGLAQEKWDEMDEDARKAMKTHPQLKVAKLEIESERAKAKAKDAPKLEI